ncbi:hypothetical protein NKG05_07660 [Oerskovia sp. M15]
MAQDAAACAAVSDVQTIVENADTALSEGRMATQEQQGWYVVAARTLHRIPSSGDSAVSQGSPTCRRPSPWSRPGPGPNPPTSDRTPGTTPSTP